MSDLISRAAAIDAVKELCEHYTPTKSVTHPHIDFVIEELQNLPSVQPERKNGRWIKNEDRSGWHCSCCGKDDLYAYPYSKNNERELQDFYCPNCGAEMRGEEE